jgi:hypothetical protein
MQGGTGATGAVLDCFRHCSHGRRGAGGPANDSPHSLYPTVLTDRVVSGARPPAVHSDLGEWSSRPMAHTAGAIDAQTGTLQEEAGDFRSAIVICGAAAHRRCAEWGSSGGCPLRLSARRRRWSIISPPADAAQCTPTFSNQLACAPRGSVTCPARWAACETLGGVGARSHGEVGWQARRRYSTVRRSFSHGSTPRAAALRASRPRRSVNAFDAPLLRAFTPTRMRRSRPKLYVHGCLSRRSAARGGTGSRPAGGRRARSCSRRDGSCSRSFSSPAQTCGRRARQHKQQRREIEDRPRRRLARTCGLWFLPGAGRLPSCSSGKMGRGPWRLSTRGSRMGHQTGPRHSASLSSVRRGHSAATSN